MAANSNTKWNFNPNLADSTTTPVLLPPSSFETTKPAVDPWNALAKATGEILDLKQENSQLKESRHMTLPVGEEIKARVDLHQHRSSPHFVAGPPSASDFVQLTHYHDIINRQAAEVAQLQKQLSQGLAESERQLGKLENQLALKETQHAHQVAVLEERLQTAEKRSEEHRASLQTTQEKWELDYSEMMNKWRNKFETTEQSRVDEINSLKQQLRQTEDQIQAVESELTEKLREYQTLVEDQRQTITNMKTYLSENETSTKSTEIWKKDFENIKQKLLDKEKEKDKIESENSLLNIRLKSQNEIMSIQEAELSKTKDGSSEKQKQCLLTRWREKVYTLLVQLKCSEIVMGDTERQWKAKLHNAENLLETCQNQCTLLQCSLQDKQAELDIERNKNQSLEAGLAQAQAVAIRLDDQSVTDQQAMDQLLIFVKQISDKVIKMESDHTTALSQLSSYNQRLGFASGRVEVLQGQFARKESHMRLEMEQLLQNKPTRDTDCGKPGLLTLNQVEAELERVTAERDSFASQIKSDAKLLEKKILAVREEVADEVSLLKQRLDDLHLTLEEKDKVCEDLRNDLSQARSEQEEATENIEVLKTQLAKLQVQSQQELEAACKEEQSRFTEQLADMEHKLNEARREHAKSVVSLRQLERQQGRDKDRSAEHAQTLEKHYQSELAKMEAKWRASEKDKNLLMATLRQEGLIGKFKSQRLPPIVSVEDSAERKETRSPVPALWQESKPSLTGHDHEPPTRDTGESLDLEETEGEATYHSALAASSLDVDEPLHVVIDDLRSLTEAVMNDGEIEDDYT